MYFAFLHSQLLNLFMRFAILVSLQEHSIKEKCLNTQAKWPQPVRLLRNKNQSLFFPKTNAAVLKALLLVFYTSVLNWNCPPLTIQTTSSLNNT